MTSTLFKKNPGYYEFQQGGEAMDLTDDMKQKEFSEENNPEKELRLKLLELLDNMPECDHRGRKWGATQGTIGSQLSEYIYHMNPELPKKIEEAKFKAWIDMVRPFLSPVFSEEKSVGAIWPRNHAGDVLQRETVAICLKLGCSFSEAFTKACLENPGMARFYYEDIRGK